jgi:hypothetical protein
MQLNTLLMEMMNDARRENLPDASSWTLRAIDIAFVLAVALPTLIAYNLAP